jgi:hypothetical protein
LAPFLRLPKISSIYGLDAIVQEFDLDDDNHNSDDDGHSDDDDDEDGDDDDDDDDDEDGEDEDDNDNDNDDNNSDHGVELIQLAECEVDAKSLVALVKSTRRLRSLIYRYDETNPGVIFFTGSLRRALQRYAQDTLENLELDFSVDEMHFTEPPGAFGPLRDFGQLKHVTAPMSLLFGEPSQGLALDFGAVLPRSLTSLSLWIDPDWDGAGWRPVVVRLLQSKRKNVPLLARLHVAGYFDVGSEEMIRVACVLGQVDVTFLSSRRRPPHNPH